MGFVRMTRCVQFGGLGSASDRVSERFLHLLRSPALEKVAFSLRHMAALVHAMDYDIHLPQDVGECLARKVNAECQVYINVPFTGAER